MLEATLQVLADLGREYRRQVAVDILVLVNRLNRGDFWWIRLNLNLGLYFIIVSAIWLDRLICIVIQLLLTFKLVNRLICAVIIFFKLCTVWNFLINSARRRVFLGIDHMLAVNHRVFNLAVCYSDGHVARALLLPPLCLTAELLLLWAHLSVVLAVSVL